MKELVFHLFATFTMLPLTVTPQAMVLVTGANRGLGREVCLQLLEQANCTLYATARKNDLLRFPTASICPILLDLEGEPLVLLETIASLPPLDCIFHVASPYSRIPLLKAELDQKMLFLRIISNEMLLLSELAKKVKKGGTLIVTGAIVGIPNMRLHTPWYIGLSSLHKGSLRALMACLYQELPDRRVIHATLGSFRDPSDGQESADSIASGKTLSTKEVATQLIRLSWNSSEPMQGFNVDIISKKEKEKMQALCN